MSIREINLGSQIKQRVDSMIIAEVTLMKKSWEASKDLVFKASAVGTLGGLSMLIAGAVNGNEETIITGMAAVATGMLLMNEANK